MAYNAANPADTQTIAAGPNDIRTNFEGLRTGQVVDAGNLKGLIPGNATGNIPVANGTQCVNLNAEKHGGNLPSAYATAAHVHAVATTSSNGPMSNTDKAKLDGIAAGAQVNQNAISNIVVGATTIQADSPTDTLTLIAGTNIALTPDATNDTVTFNVTGKVASAATADTCTGNAATATKWGAARTLTLGGDCTGTVSIDGTGNMTLTVVVVDDSHNHIIANVDGLQTALDDKLISTGTAANASKVGNYSPATTNTVSTAAIRDSSGDLVARLFRTEYTGGGGNCTYILGQNSIGAGADNYARPIPLATLKTALGVPTIDGNRLWISDNFVPTTVGVPVTIAHGLTLDPRAATAELCAICTTANNGYAVGDVINDGIGANTFNSYVTTLNPTLSDTTISINMIQSLNIYIRAKTGNTMANPALTAGWAMFFRIRY